MKRDDMPKAVWVSARLSDGPVDMYNVCATRAEAMRYVRLVRGFFTDDPPGNHRVVKYVLAPKRKRRAKKS